MVVLSTTLAGINLPLRFMNASGAWSGTREELSELAASATGAIVLKTTTTEARVEEVRGCGIENPGQPYYLGLIPALKGSGKPIIGSVAGFTVAEYVGLAQAYAHADVPIIELNLSDRVVPCNRGGTCDLAAVEEVVKAVRAAIRIPLAVKLPALPETAFGGVGDLLKRHHIDILVCNTPQVETFAKALGSMLDIIGVGGVSSGKDAHAALSRGAKAVQIGSALMTEGPGVFDRLRREFEAESASHQA